MRIRRHAILVAALVLVLLSSACASGGAKGAASGGAGEGGKASVVPAAFKGDGANAVELAVKADGGKVAVRSGNATAGIVVPGGAAPVGATWTIVPLTAAAAGAKKPLCPGVYVDTSAGKPTKPCLLAFAIPGRAPAGACIVKLSDDGSGSQIVATTRSEIPHYTILSAEVDGFSAYTTSEEDKAAADKAFQDREKARGKQVDWTIKAGGTETQKVEGWTFNYELDFFASGGGVGMGGTYKGHSSLSIDGTYKGPASIIKSFGTVKGIGRDQNLTFNLIDVPLANLVTGEDVEMPPSGQGTMKLDGMGSLDISAVGPNVRGRYNKNNVKGSDGVPFTILVKGDDVQIEIPKCGIFPGKILRTSK
jgi:hypothetical protein